MRRATTSLLLLICALMVATMPFARAQSALWPSSNGLLAFRSDRDGDAELFTLAATGENPAPLTENEGIVDSQPAWSPDGRRIAFVRTMPQSGRSDLWTATSEGKGRVRITSTPFPERDPSWSPDGTKIVYAARTRGSGPFRIFVAKPDGTARAQLTTQPLGSADRAPVWSPDGTKIAFMSDRGGGFAEIYVMNADGTGEQALTANDVVDANPSWSPDGTRIAVERCCPDGSSDIFTIDVVTGVETNLTNSTSFMDFDPSWSPDGTTIAFVSFQIDEGNIDIWSIHADGTFPTRLTEDPSDDLSPDWQPLPVCTINGTDQSDLELQGTDANDVICALGGDDVVKAGLGHDLVLGGRGNDTIEGQGGTDVIHGDQGDDLLNGGPDYDLLDGGSGLDTCVRGAQGAFIRLCEL
jgi:Tol biopolymer transport system component